MHKLMAVEPALEALHLVLIWAGTCPICDGHLFFLAAEATPG
jgi:hypothetical protein